LKGFIGAGTFLIDYFSLLVSSKTLQLDYIYLLMLNSYFLILKTLIFGLMSSSESIDSNESLLFLKLANFGEIN
jgi:hypothetical protein